MKTEHEQLLELQPLMETLGWWPEEIFLVDSGISCILVERETFDQLEEIPDNFALYIVTGIAEKELVRTKRWGSALSCVDEGRKFILFDSMDNIIKEDLSIADALRVELERQGEPK